SRGVWGAPARVGGAQAGARQGGPPGAGRARRVRRTERPRPAAGRLSHRSQGLLPARSQAPARGVGGALRGGGGGAFGARLSLRAGPDVRAAQDFAGGDRAGGGGERGGAAAP